uniref:Plastid-lipid-associated protein n=1 Tax=Rhizophora mucronata TaxID=61149 RepID=A0A2P2K0S8_RHIMU
MLLCHIYSWFVLLYSCEIRRLYGYLALLVKKRVVIFHKDRLILFLHNIFYFHWQKCNKRCRLSYVNVLII